MKDKALIKEWKNSSLCTTWWTRVSRGTWSYNTRTKQIST